LTKALAFNLRPGLAAACTISFSITAMAHCGIRRDAADRLARFLAKWRPVRVKKTRQNKNQEPRFDSIEAENL
jgi:hypothetical protein